MLSPQKNNWYVGFVHKKGKQQGVAEGVWLHKDALSAFYVPSYRQWMFLHESGELNFGYTFEPNQRLPDGRKKDNIEAARILPKSGEGDEHERSSEDESSETTLHVHGDMAPKK